VFDKTPLHSSTNLFAFSASKNVTSTSSSTSESTSATKTELTTPPALKFVKEEQQQLSIDKKPQPPSNPFIQANTTTTRLPHKHFQAEFKQEMKNFKLVKENVDTTTTTTTASSNVTGAQQTTSNLKLKGNSNNFSF
jgi:hypothetical protein